MVSKESRSPYALMAQSKDPMQPGSPYPRGPLLIFLPKALLTRARSCKRKAAINFSDAFS